jgi:hypothetical protein
MVMVEDMTQLSLKDLGGVTQLLRNVVTNSPNLSIALSKAP